jgi:hypothetical protein
MAKKPSLDKKVDIGEPISIDENDAMYHIFMDIQKFNYERGFITEKSYERVKKGKLFSQRYGRRTYFFIRDSV